MNKKHFDNFKRYAEETYGREWWFGCNVKQWRDSLVDGNNIKCKKLKSRLCKLNVPDSTLTRKQLKEICEDFDNSALHCLVSVMAWATSTAPWEKERNKNFFNNNNISDIENIIDELRNSKNDSPHLKSYEQFLNTEINISSFVSYSKIIFFCQQIKKETGIGYILDQWTARSINLLMDKKIVNISGNNCLCQYKHYCESIDYLQKCLPKNSGQDIEKALFSNGGHCLHRWRWRKHVAGVYSDAKKDFAKADPCTCGNKK